MHIFNAIYLNYRKIHLTRTFSIQLESISRLKPSKWMDKISNFKYGTLQVKKDLELLQHHITEVPME